MTTLIPTLRCRLAVAAEHAFPFAGMTASGLRKERDRGRLTTWMIAGKDEKAMPHRSTGPHLWLRKERRSKDNLLARSTWIIIDSSKHITTGCDANQVEEAQGRLAAYIADKYRANRRLRDIEDIEVVLALYDEDYRERQANKPKFDERLIRLTE
jgi:hypothetical protein